MAQTVCAPVDLSTAARLLRLVTADPAPSAVALANGLRGPSARAAERCRLSLVLVQTGLAEVPAGGTAYRLCAVRSGRGLI